MIRGCGPGSCGRDRVALPARVWVKSCVGVWRQLVVADVGWLERARCGSWSRNVQQQEEQEEEGSASPASQLAAAADSRRAPSGRLSPNLCNQLSHPKALLLCLHSPVPASSSLLLCPLSFLTSVTQTHICGFNSLNLILIMYMDSCNFHQITHCKDSTPCNPLPRQINMDQTHTYSELSISIYFSSESNMQKIQNK